MVRFTSELSELKKNAQEWAPKRCKTPPSSKFNEAADGNSIKNFNAALKKNFDLIFISNPN